MKIQVDTAFEKGKKQFQEFSAKSTLLLVDIFEKLRENGELRDINDDDEEYSEKVVNQHLLDCQRLVDALSQEEILKLATVAIAFQGVETYHTTAKKVVKIVGNAEIATIVTERILRLSAGQSTEVNGVSVHVNPGETSEGTSSPGSTNIPNRNN